MTGPAECLEYGDDCRGPVEYHTVSPGAARAFPRCEFHWDRRLARREQSLERYADSTTPPEWFDPAYAGESWDE